MINLFSEGLDYRTFRHLIDLSDCKARKTYSILFLDVKRFVKIEDCKINIIF